MAITYHSGGRLQGTATTSATSSNGSTGNASGSGSGFSVTSSSGLIGQGYAQASGNYKPNDKAWSLGNDGWTFNFWANPQSASENDYYLHFEPQTGAWRNTFYMYNTTSGIAMNFKDNTNTQISTSSISMTNGSWNMITMTWNNSDNKLRTYKNSDLHDTSTYTHTNAGNFGTPEKNWVLGNYAGQTGTNYASRANGLDEWSWWTAPLTQADITELYNNGSGIKATELSSTNKLKLKVYYDFEDFVNGTLTNQAPTTAKVQDAKPTDVPTYSRFEETDTRKIYHLNSSGVWKEKGLFPSDLPTISGLKLHLDASDASTITKDGSNLVSAWNDKSGEGNHISQSTASKQPLWVVNTQNGLPLIRFDGSNDQLNRSTFVSGAISQGFYMFVVMKPSAGGSAPPYNFDGGSGARGWCYTNSSGSLRYGAGIEQGIDSSLPSTPAMYTFFIDGSSSDVRKNSVSTASGTFGSSTINGLWLACRHSDVTFGSPDYAEFLFYDNDIGTTNRDVVESYLMGKWGL